MKGGASQDLQVRDLLFLDDGLDTRPRLVVGFAVEVLLDGVVRLRVRVLVRGV